MTVVVFDPARPPSLPERLLRRREFWRKYKELESASLRRGRRLLLVTQYTERRTGIPLARWLESLAGGGGGLEAVSPFLRCLPVWEVSGRDRPAPARKYHFYVNFVPVIM